MCGWEAKMCDSSLTIATLKCFRNKHTHTHTRLTALFPGLHRWAGTRKGKSIWILLKQETVSGSGISWAMCKSAPRSRQITTPAPHHSVFYRPDALPATQPTASEHWRQIQKQAVHDKVLYTTTLLKRSQNWQPVVSCNGRDWWKQLNLHGSMLLT